MKSRIQGLIVVDIVVFIHNFVDTKCASVGFEIDRMIEQLKQEIALLGQYKTQMAADIIPELDTLTNILKEFHDIFGNIEWTDEDKIKKQINDIIESVRRDEKYNNAMQFSDKQNARDESDRAAHEAVMNSMQSGLELFREVQNNPSFRKWLFDSAFNSTYQANHNQTSL